MATWDGSAYLDSLQVPVHGRVLTLYAKPKVLHHRRLITWASLTHV